jgi:GntR family transcriptional regulator
MSVNVTLPSAALQRDGHVPLYVQIRDLFVAEIEDGRLQAEDQLPSEPELVARFNVGRPTVRQALGLLRQEGWVVTRRGAGTFVTSPRPRVSLMSFDGLTRALQARGFDVADEVLGDQIEVTPPLDVLQLSDEGDDAWWTVRRLRRVRDGKVHEPLCVEVDAFNLRLCPDAAALFAASGSAASVLEASYGYGVSACEVATRAVAADAHTAKLLGVRKGHPLLAMERVNRGADDATVHVVSYLLRTDVVPVVETLVNQAGRR